MSYFDPIVAPAVVQERTYVFKTKDGDELIGQMYAPSGRKPFAIVLINGATGVPQGFYSAFAEWLAREKGLACFTYDYRDIGRSLRGSLRKSTARMSDWGIADAEAARRFVRYTLPNVPIWMMGHSLGGMMLPFQRDFSGVTRVINVSSGAVLPSDHPKSYRMKALLFWHVVGPLLTAGLGYLPSKLVGLGESLPASVFWQWRRWCTRAEFYDPDAGFELPSYEPDQLRMPIKFVSIVDDELCTLHSTQKLVRRYERGDIAVIDPRPNGDHLGHMGIFRKSAEAYWHELIA